MDTVVRRQKGQSKKDAMSGPRTLFQDTKLGLTPSIMVGREPDVSFLAFFEQNKERIANIVAATATRFPTMFSSCDYRWEKSDFMGRVLSRKIKELTDNPVIGYDMLYDRTDRVSLKIMEKVFQRGKKTGRFHELTKPKDIILKNKNGSKECAYKREEYFDHLLVVETLFKYENRMICISLGVTTFDNIIESDCILPVKTEQVKCKINNSQYHCFYKHPGIKIKDAGKEHEDTKNAWYNDAKDRLADEMLEQGRKDLGLSPEDF